MRRLISIASGASGVFVMLMFLSHFAAADEPSVAVGPESRTRVNLTLYHGDMGLVREERNLLLGKGVQWVRFRGVPAGTVAESVLLTGTEVPVIEQRFVPGALTYQGLLDAHLGRDVMLVSRNPVTGAEERKPARLLSATDGIVLQSDGGIIVDPEGRVVFPSLPEGLVREPELRWRLESRAAGPHTFAVSYLTSGIGWYADYIVTLDEASGMADIICWLSVDNRTGVAFRDAALTLVAGEVHRAIRPVQLMKAEAFDRKAMMAEAMPEPEQAEPERFFEYYVYDVPVAVTLLAGETSQVKLRKASGVPYTKRYVFHGEGVPSAQYGRADVEVEMMNTKEAGLGVPLPQGMVRLYGASAPGELRFIGEDRVEHIAEAERVALKVGEAFDIVIEKRQTSYDRGILGTIESGYEVRIRNRKDQDVTVSVLDRFHGEWKVKNSSHKPIKRDAFTLEFEVPVAARGEAILLYSVKSGG